MESTRRKAVWKAALPPISTASVSSRDTAVAMEIISREWIVHKLNLHLTSQICHFGGKVKRLTIFLVHEKISLALTMPSSPFQLGRLSPHCGPELKKGCFTLLCS